MGKRRHFEAQIRILVSKEENGVISHRTITHRYTPSYSLFSNESEKSLVNRINEDIIESILKRNSASLTWDQYEKKRIIIQQMDIISYNEKNRRAYLPSFKDGTVLSVRHQLYWKEAFGIQDRIEMVVIQFERALAEALGFYHNTQYRIYSTNKDSRVGFPKKKYATHSPRCDGSVHNILVYSDIVARNRFSDQMINVIDVLPVKGGTEKTKSLVYKKMNPTSTITDLSLKLRCQRGLPIRFAEGSDVLAILHVRERTS